MNTSSTRHPRLAAGLASLAVLTSLSGCAPMSVQSASAPAATPSVSSTASASASASPSHPPKDGLSDGADIGTAPPPSADSSEDAIGTAVKAMRLYARPDVPPQQWINELLPVLSQQAGDAYADTDPQSIPVRSVDSNGTLRDGASANAALVDVGTDQGTYTVSLSRASASGPWLVARLTPPAGN